MASRSEPARLRLIDPQGRSRRGDPLGWTVGICAFCQLATGATVRITMRHWEPDGVQCPTCGTRYDRGGVLTPTL